MNKLRFFADHCVSNYLYHPSGHFAVGFAFGAQFSVRWLSDYHNIQIIRKKNAFITV